MYFFKRLVFLSLLFLFPVLSITAQVSITTLGEPGAYIQNFNFLGTTDYSLVDNSPSNPGIYAFRTTVPQPGPNIIDAETGTDTTGEFNNYGAAGDVDRAFGSLASGGTGSLQYGIRFINNTGVTITSVEVRYTGEQWRSGGNPSAQTLGFAYRQAPTITDFPLGAYLGVSALDFVSPTNTAAASALNGNDAANRTVITATFLVTIPPNEEILIRWIDNNDAGNDHGLAIDDLTVIFRAGTTAADASIAGRVVTTDGRGIANMRLTVSGGDLTEPVMALTSSFGYYRVEGLQAGQTYVVSIAGSKRYNFETQSRLVTLGEDALDVDFVGEPR